MSDDWHIDGAALRRIRSERGMSVVQLAMRAGLDRKTVSHIEARSPLVRPETAGLLAKALSVEIEALLLNRKGVTPARLHAPTKLESLAAHARAHRNADGPANQPPPLDAHQFQSIMSAYLVHDDTRWSFTGRLDQQRGVPKCEAVALGSKGGIATRFYVVQQTEHKQPLEITVHVRDKDSVARLQQLLGEHRVVRFVLRVSASEIENGRATVTGCSKDLDVHIGQETFGGFSVFGKTNGLRPWTFVVEDFAPVDLDSDGRKKPKRPPIGSS